MVSRRDRPLQTWKPSFAIIWRGLRRLISLWFRRLPLSNCSRFLFSAIDGERVLADSTFNRALPARRRLFPAKEPIRSCQVLSQRFERSAVANSAGARRHAIVTLRRPPTWAASCLLSVRAEREKCERDA